MKNDNKNAKKKSKAIDILLYTICFVFFGLALFGAITRLTSDSFYIFNSRFDVVLTDSMSEKHPDHVEFLKNHNDQYQKMDLVISTKVRRPSDVKLYDVVIFNDPIFGNNMHRIVDMIEDRKDIFTLEKVDKGELLNYKGLFFNEIGSSVVTNELTFDTLQMTTFITEDDESIHFNFNVMSNEYLPKVATKKVKGGYIKTYSFKRDSKAPGKLVIAHHHKYDFEKEIITEIRLNTLYEDSVISYNSEISSDNGINTIELNQTYRYEIRGDKQKDGEIYELKDIQSKVVGKLPAAGYVMKYLSSIWGVIMFTCLGIGCIVVDILLERQNKLDKKEQAENTLVDSYENELSNERKENNDE